MNSQLRIAVIRAIFRPLAVVIGCAAMATGLVVAANDNPLPDGFNKLGNYLIADQFNNRVIEIDQKGNIVWQFGIGPDDFSSSSILGVNDSERVGINTLMAGTGIPPGVDPNAPNGVADNRVILVDPYGTVIWQYGQFGVTGSGPNELNAPVQATALPRGHVLITDQGNQRVIEVKPDREIVWQYGMTGTAGDGPNELNSPNSAELLTNGHILIADEGNNRVIEVERDGTIVATFTAGGTVSGAAFASRLNNDHTLITDGGNNRIVEVDQNDNVVWQYYTNTDPNSNPNPAPSRAIRLANGNTIISDQFNDRVIVITPKQVIVEQYGNLNDPGFGVSNTSQGLNAPYDAKRIGDYTGLTEP
jgi:hypothetical protein